jgi:uncharacterized membrane protein
MILKLFALLVLGLMCGSELNVAVFAHPLLNQQPHDAHILVRSSFARLLGRVMPFWMSTSAVLNLVLLLPFEHSTSYSWYFALVAFVLQIAAVVFSLVGPVPINNRIAKWTPQTVPSDWREQERRWDVYHWLRTSGLVVAFAFLAAGIAV